MSAAATIRKGRRPCRTGSGAWRRARLMSPGQLLEHVVDRDAARPEQDDRVEPQVGDLLHDAAVALATERGGDDLGRLLADLAGDRRLAAREQSGHVRPGGGARLSAGPDPPETPRHPGPPRSRPGRPGKTPPGAPFARPHPPRG